MEKILDCLYSMSSDIHGILNGSGDFQNGTYWARGKVYFDINEAYAMIDKWSEQKESFYSTNNNGEIIGAWGISDEETDNAFEILDCRNKNVDFEIKKFTKNTIVQYISDFYSQNNGDDFLLLLGFAINLYYIVGLYQVFGKFPIKEIPILQDESGIVEYAHFINDFLYVKNRERIFNNIQFLHVANEDLYEKSVKAISEKKKNSEYHNLECSISECDRNYVPELYMALIEDGGVIEDSDEILDKMVSMYPQFRFGLVYQCLKEAFQFYNSKGKNTRVYRWREKLGVELFLHILGIKSLDCGKFELVNGEIKTIRPVIFSNFGIGIPKIKTISKEKIYADIDSLKTTKISKEVTNETIQNQTEAALGVGCCVQVEDNPLKYTGTLFEELANKEDELRAKNAELEKLQEQKKKMVNHLAHSWGNECYPEIVKKVANELLKNGNNSLANRLFKAYNSENNLMGEIVFLQAAMDDEPETLKRIFANSFYLSGNGTEDMKVKTLINEALEILVFGLMNDLQTKEKRKRCCNNISVKHSLAELADDYTSRFENGSDSVPFLNWFTENIFPIEVDIDETWNKINFGKTEYGKIVLKNIFTELFTNVILHGHEKCSINLTSSQDALRIEVRNLIGSDFKSGQKGLSSLKEIVSRLNYNTNVSEEDGLKHGRITETTYLTEITFAKELMYIEED